MDDLATRLNVIAAMFGFDPIATAKPQPPRDKCVSCGAKIQPGRPGRKCKDCRAQETPKA